MSFKIRKLSYVLGAEITGIDLSKPLDNASINGIRSAFLEHHVLVFREQRLTREQHVGFSRLFGDVSKNELKPANRKAPDFPEIFLVIGKPTRPGEVATGWYSGQVWHSDHPHYPVAGQASILYGVELPDLGGGTQFCNMYRAYETLSDGMKKLLEGLYGVHIESIVFDHSSPEAYAESKRLNPAAAHPLVRVHPETGRKALFVDGKIRLIVGMTSEESKPLIQYLTQHATRTSNVYRHQWQKGDLVMWDNRCLLHMALGDYDRSQNRHMERTTIRGMPSGYVYDGPLE